MNFRKNLYDLISDAHRYQYSDIAESKDDAKKKKPLLYFTLPQWSIIVLSISITLLIKNGFSENFAGYIISGLSLFVGIFFTFLITLYDKFKSIDFNQFQKSVNEVKYPIGVKLKNFFKKVSVLALYSVIISIVSILLLSATLIFPQINIEIDIFNFIKSIDEQTVCTIIKTSLIIIYRVIVLYFLLDFLLITLYIISSFYDFIVSEINKVKLS
jgi:hypothetical protein